VSTALTRHIFLCVLSTFVAISDSDTLARLSGSEPENRTVERCNHYCLHSTVAGASFLTLAAQSQRTWFLPIPKHKMTAHVY
jgi:hypothetical protein